jgi:hypothetical protein
MTTDLEADIHCALQDRVEYITPDRLRHIDEPRTTKGPAPRTRWANVGPITAAACVALIAVAITFAPAGHKNQTNSPGARAGLTSLVGTSWGLTSVRADAGTSTTIPQNLGASVTFERGGVFSAQGGANAYRATYKITTATEILVAEPTAQTTGGSIIGHDRSAAASANGIHAILYTAGGRATPQPVTVSHGPNQLKLTANGYTLIVADEVPVATSSAPPCSSMSGR